MQIYLSERSPIELLAVIIGKSKAELLWDKYPSIKRIAMLSVEELHVEGLSKLKASQLQASVALGRLYSIESAPQLETASAHTLGYNLSLEMELFDKEVVRCLSLNVRNEIIGDQIVSIGTLDSCILHPRDIFRSAVSRNAHSIIVVHNHPSGNPEPSNEDVAITRRLQSAGAYLGIPLKDHIIVGKNGKYVSLLQKGIL